MNKDEKELTDDLRPEYDLNRLRIRRLGPGRKEFGHLTVQLEPDVAAAFPTAQSVNEALRFLLRIARDHQSSIPKPRGGA